MAQDSFGFRPLEPPDTILSLDALQEPERPCDVVDAQKRTITIAANGDERHAVLAKPWGDRWLAYPLADGASRWGYALEGFTDDGRHLRMSTWSTNVVTGYQYFASDLVLIDLERAMYVQIPTMMDELKWEPFVETDSIVEHSSLDTSTVTLAPPYVIIQNGCLEDKVPVPCAHPGGVYTFTPEALVMQPGLSATPVAPSTAPLMARDRFPFIAKDSLCPRLYGPNAHLMPLDSADRTRLLQEEAVRYAHDQLYLFAQLPDAMGPRITILCSNNDAYDLLWVSYDATGRLNGLDTLASQYGDGQEHRTECAYYDRHGVFSVQVVDDATLRDDVDTMAYMLDTLVYEVRTDAVAYIGEENGESRHRYGLVRWPHDLTARWVECHNAKDLPPHSWRSVKELIPADRRVLQWVTGDLDRDGRPDHALVLTNAADDADRDLLILSTAVDACGFVEKASFPGFLPNRDSGGFHDPIGEPGISGISIIGDSLVIRIFGGSAWKWQERSVYQYSPAQNEFYLVRNEGRSYHAASLDTLDEELRYFEDAERQGRTLTRAELERRTELRKMEQDFAWKVEVYPRGERLMGR